MATRTGKAAVGSTKVTAGQKAARTGKWAEIIFRALSKRVADRWQFISFRGKGGGEWRGIVDVLAIRKCTDDPSTAELKRGDLFDVVLVQIKGGSAAWPTDADCARLATVRTRYAARSVVLFEWKKGVSSKLYELGADMQWHDTSGEAIFGRSLKMKRRTAKS